MTTGTNQRRAGSVKVNLAKIQPTMASLEWMSAVDPEIKEGCVIKMVDAFSLKFQRDSWKNALAVDPAKGKIGKKAVFSTALWR